MLVANDSWYWITRHIPSESINFIEIVNYIDEWIYFELRIERLNRIAARERVFELNFVDVD